MMNKLNYAVATGLGVGCIPVGPGTAASLITCLIVYFLYPFPVWQHLFALFVLILAGVYVSGEVEREIGNDPSLVVIDEIAGMMLSLLFVPDNWLFFLMVFILFRFFDIAKPPPVNSSQKLKGGIGIMIDDILAGLYTLLVFQLIYFLFF